MKIRVDVQGTPVTATLDDSRTARDFDALRGTGPLKTTIEPVRDH